MSTGRRWQDIKADAHRRYPELADPERQARARAELDAYIADNPCSLTASARPSRTRRDA